MNDVKKWYRDEMRLRKSRSEEFALEILNGDGLKALRAIPCSPRSKSYDANHKKSYWNVDEPRTEKQIAKALYEKTFQHIGKILDYEVPLNDTRTQGDGDIDLIAYNEDESTLFLLELKCPKSDETLLRSVLEIFTYSKIICHQKLKEDFHLSPDVKVIPAVLLFENSYAYNEYKDKKRPNAIELMKKLEVEFYGIRKNTNNNYGVFLS